MAKRPHDFGSGRRPGLAPLGPKVQLPDVRDGLTPLERAVLVALRETQAELGGRNVPTAMLYGRVAERYPVGVAEFIRTLERLVGSRVQPYEVGGLRGRRGPPEGR